MGDKTPLTVNSSRTRPAWRRRLAFFTIACLLLIALLEGVVRIGVALLKRNVTLLRILERQREAAVPTSPTRTQVMSEVVHPYVGFVVDPTLVSGFNQFGFLQVDGPILKRRSGQIVVGITGGSVARDVCHASAATIKRRITELTGVQDVAVVCMAQEGFHQPQQVMTWSLFRSLGAEFDYLVNLDGFNEVALYQSETSDDATWYAYPRTWETRLSDTANPELNRLIGLGVTLKERRIRWAILFNKLERLPLLSVHLAWNAMDGGFRKAIADVTAQIQKAKTASQKQYSHAGPAVRFPSREDRAAALAELWAQSSVNLSQMCAGAGTNYVHCLQPNIAIKRKETLTDIERKLVDPNAYYRQAATLGYPKLFEKSGEIRSQGVNYVDLTGLYTGVSGAIYSDDCCHMTQLGNDLIASAIAKAVAKPWQSRN